MKLQLLLFGALALACTPAAQEADSGAPIDVGSADAAGSDGEDIDAPDSTAGPDAMLDAPVDQDAPVACECTPGEISMEVCRCDGYRTRTCNERCEWGLFGECVARGCEPNTVETRSCNCGTGTQTRNCIASCEYDEWSACEGGPSFPVALGTGEIMCPPYDRPAVFFAAHQDDESIGMAGAIREHVLAGRDVFVELMTHGRTSGVYERMNDGGTHAWHPGTHSHPVTRDEFGDARTREFIDATTRLGVAGVHVSDFGVLTVAEVATRIDFWTTHGGSGLSLKGTAGDNDPSSLGGVPHSDHDAVWDALVASGFSDVRGYLIYHYTSGAGFGFNTVTLSPALCAAKANALDAYRVWDPPNGRYAIGYHSVSALLNAARSACREYIVIP